MTSLPDGPAFSTDRLLVRDWAAADAPRMLDMYSRPEVVRFLGSVPTPMQSVDEALDRIGTRGEWNARQRAAGRPYGWWAVEAATGLVVGTVALLPVGWSDEPDAPVEAAWHLHPDAQGNGYATEAARAVLDRGHATGLTEIVALTDPENTPSQAVCRRLGLELLETSDRFYDKPLLIWVSRR